MRKTNKIVYWVSTIWLGLGMLSAALVQLSANGAQAGFIHLGYPTYFLQWLGACKILGVIVLFFPRSPLLKEWAYAGFFFTLSGAVFSHIAAGVSVKEIFPSILLLILTFVSWYFRPSEKRIMAVGH